MTRRRRPRRSGALTELPPLRILSQIAVLQGLFYAAAAPLMLFTALVSGRPFSANLVLGWSAVRGDTAQGWLVAFVWVLAGGLFSSISMVVFVVRSKLVLDFALTLHAVHLAVVFLYTHSVPENLAWWLTMAASSALCVSLGTWGCQYRELRPISFGGRSVAAAAAAAGGPAAAVAAATAASTPTITTTAPSPRAGSSAAAAAADAIVTGDEEQGFSRGRGRGRGRDGAGDYEMVSMPSDDRRQD